MVKHRSKMKIKMNCKEQDNADVVLLNRTKQKVAELKINELGFY